MVDKTGLLIAGIMIIYALIRIICVQGEKHGLFPDGSLRSFFLKETTKKNNNQEDKKQQFRNFYKGKTFSYRELNRIITSFHEGKEIIEADVDSGDEELNEELPVFILKKTEDEKYLIEDVLYEDSGKYDWKR